eukprot:TRINITY_DN10251_c0_g1_i20.p2 TRINITY_DN10251_c0_g1~~TRINITY_DN10251_c0_g1_i20.p2  ORF type:complete len:215 (-),score=-10.49 TRINITY_DN10251_c0_g1_i20:1048-1692(-)
MYIGTICLSKVYIYLQREFEKIQIHSDKQRFLLQISEFSKQALCILQKFTNTYIYVPVGTRNIQNMHMHDNNFFICAYVQNNTITIILFPTKELVFGEQGGVLYQVLFEMFQGTQINIYSRSLFQNILLQNDLKIEYLLFSYLEILFEQNYRQLLCGIDNHKVFKMNTQCLNNNLLLHDVFFTHCEIIEYLLCILWKHASTLAEVFYKIHINSR